jgi:hypothetical protein
MQNVLVNSRMYAARQRASTHLHSRTAQLVMNAQRASMQHTVHDQRMTGCTGQTAEAAQAAADTVHVYTG